MHPVLRDFKTAYVKTQNLLPLFSEYANPRDLISRMVKSEELIRLKNGFFVIADKIKDSQAPFEQIGNLLYGPSYISLEWALSHYGMIPEGVYVVTSVTMSQSKNFPTPIGTFDYTFLNPSRYAIGIDQKENEAGRYLIATPEKALADLVHFKSKNLKKRELLIDLTEARRIDEEVLKKLDKRHMQEIADCYRSRSVNEISSLLGLL